MPYKKPLPTESLFCGMYIDSDGFAICLIDAINFRSQGFKVVEIIHEDVNLGKINELVNQLETSRHVFKFGINKPFNKEIIETREVIDDLDFDLFNGMIQLKSMINDTSLKIDKNLEIYTLLRDYEKDTVNHQVFSLVMAVSLLVNNMSTLRYWDYWANYKGEPVMDS